MKPDEIVCSFECSKSLKEVGVKQDGLFHWGWNKEGDELVCCEYYTGSEPDDNIASAFTVTELLEKIPKIIQNPKVEVDPSYLRIFTDDCISWCVGHGGIGYELYADNSDDSNLANVLAGMLIHLIKEGFVKP